MSRLRAYGGAADDETFTLDVCTLFSLSYQPYNMSNNLYSSSKSEARHLAWPILMVIATLFTGILAWEIATPTVDGQAVVTVPSFEQTAPPKMPAKRQADDNSRWADAAVARPLFSQNRRPLADNAVAAVSAPYTLPRLTGVIVGPDGGSAIFAGAASGKPMIVRPGDRLGPAVIETIETGQVNLRGPNGLVVLRPVFQDITIQMSEVDPGVSAKPGYRPRQEGHYSAFWKSAAANRPGNTQ